MERAIYCSLSELQRLLDSFDSNPQDWRLTILTALDSVFAYTEDPNFYFKSSEFDEQSFLACFDGTSSSSENALALSKRVAMNKWLGGKLKPVRGITGLFPQRLVNGAICRSLIGDSNMMRRNGIESIDDINDKWASNLRSSWYEEAIKSKHFSWAEFFGNNIPTSSAAVLVDRYLFKKVECVNNIASIIKAIVPNCFIGDYFITFIFEYSDNVNWRGNEIALKDALGSVCDRLVDIFKDKKVSCVINFIAIVKPPKNINYSFKQKKAWSGLHYCSHDRKIITSYYQVSATLGLSVTSSSNPDQAFVTQDITFKPLLSNIDNPKQKPSSLPFYTISRQLQELTYKLSDVPPCAIRCYQLDYSGDRRILSDCTFKEIKNPLLEIRDLT